ncbi:hypothetical protein SAMD00023353_0601760 [Rosellinia necatrix]|uniref:Uncharacterized protein n=1 Tax=Rosellinia necatrix TaxID=77044 RepID=A0A1S7ULW0_ROSNE|nr:hypothetical protein SAMD00023353_0601760 [Rosellinia necatrix]
MPSDLFLLAKNVDIGEPTQDYPFYRVSVSNDRGCLLSIAATKALPDPLVEPRVPPEPKDYISITHNEDRCICASHSLFEATLFKVWQDVHIALRHSHRDQASYAFYPKHEYEIGEALAHASLVVKLAIAQRIPSCYDYLISEHGAARLYRAYQIRLAIENGESVSEASIAFQEEVEGDTS